VIANGAIDVARPRKEVLKHNVAHQGMYLSRNLSCSAKGASSIQPSRDVSSGLTECSNGFTRSTQMGLVTQNLHALDVRKLSPKFSAMLPDQVNKDD